jgi:hypothetical protein
VGKVVQPLQSINCHDSRAHGHERHRPFTRLVGVWLGLCGSSQFSSWYAAGVKLVCMVLGLVTGGMHVSVGFGTGGMHVSVGLFGYRCDSCELVALGYS